MSGLLANTQQQPQPGFWRGLLDAFGQDAAAARDWFISNMQRASGGGILNEGETDTGARAGAGMSLAGAAMTGAAPGGIFAAPRGALGAGPIRAYHGSPHDFDRFDLSKIGTGEGAQAYGHGLYFAENEGVARSYRDALASPMFKTAAGELFDPQSQIKHLNVRVAAHRNGPNLDATIERARQLQQSKTMSQEARAMLDHDIAVLQKFKDAGGVSQNPGRMYEVAIHADPERFLDWDKPLAQQAPEIKSAVGGLVDRIGKMPNKNGPVNRMRDEVVSGVGTGADLLNRVEYLYGKPGAFPEITVPDRAAAANVLRDAGIPGVRYLDGFSRGAGDGSRNYVVFDDKLIEILRKYGLLAPTVAAGGGLLATQDSQAAPR